MEQMILSPIDSTAIELKMPNNDTKVINSRLAQTDIFNALSRAKITKINRNKLEDILKIIIDDQCTLTINSYSKLKRKSHFNSLKDKIRKYYLDLLVSKVSQKVNVKGLVCAGSLVTTITAISFNLSANLEDTAKNMSNVDQSEIINEIYSLELDDEIFDDEFYEQKWENDMQYGAEVTASNINEDKPEEYTLNLDDNGVEGVEQNLDNDVQYDSSVTASNINESKPEEYILNLDDNGVEEVEQKVDNDVQYGAEVTTNNINEAKPEEYSLNPEDKNMEEIDAHQNHTSLSTIDESEIEKFEDFFLDNDNIEDEPTEEFMEVKNSNVYSLDDESTNVADNYIDFNDLKNFTSYDEYIRFAAKLFYVDYDIAKQVVEQNAPSFNTPSENVSGQATYELNRMKDLKERGIINGDINIIGIFIKIKDYAIDNLALNRQEPIISDKNNAQREQDLVNVAKYIYGIDNPDMLNVIIAIHRIETHSGDASITTEKNNLGGNIDPTSDYNHPRANVYKTTEIGAESAIRNFLNVYDKCIYRENSSLATTIPEFLCETYCPHTPEAWKTEVSNMVNEGTIQSAIESYLGESGKTY